MSTVKERVNEVKKKRRELESVVKRDFFESVEKCPCCKKESSNIDVGFWFGGTPFSLRSPKWTIKCNACGFCVGFWSSSGKKAAEKFGDSFRQAVALRLMGKKKKRRKRK